MWPQDKNHKKREKPSVVEEAPHGMKKGTAGMNRKFQNLGVLLGGASVPLGAGWKLELCEALHFLLRHAFPS